MKITLFRAFFAIFVAIMLFITPAAASPSADDLIDAGYIALNSGNSRMAEDLFARALGSGAGQNSPLAWAGLGKALWNESSSSHEASYTAFNRSLSIENVSSEDWETVVIVFFDEPIEDFELSYAAGLKAVKADPKDPVAWNYLGCALDRLAINNTDADLNGPFDAFKQALALDPSSLYSYNTGYYAIVTGNYTYAVEVTDRALKNFNPDTLWEGSLLFIKALALAEMGESERALNNIALSGDAYNLDESYEWSEYDSAADAFVRAIALNDLGRFDESVELLKRGTTDTLGDYLEGLLITPEMYMDVYGVALSGAGQKDDAVIAFEKSLEYNSDYEPAKEHLKNLNTN